MPMAKFVQLHGLRKTAAILARRDQDWALPTVFEPITIYKGDHARMHFYMAVRYAGSSYFASCDWANAGADLKDWYKTMLVNLAHHRSVAPKRDNSKQCYLCISGQSQSLY